MSTGKKIFVCLRLCVILVVLLTNTITAPAQKKGSVNNVKSKIVDAYKQYFGLDVPSPAYVGSRSDDMGRYWTSTAYRDSLRYRLYLLADGTVLPFAGEAKRPYGTYRVAVVAIDYGNTNIATLLSTLWTEVQQEMNNNYFQYASACGNDKAMVQFINTNFLASSTEIASPRNTEEIISYVLNQGHKREDFDIYVALDLNPQSPAGGFANYGGNFAYIGYYFAKRDFADLGQLASYDKSELFWIGKALYDHEIGHIFGWEHEWTISTKSRFLPDDPITDPVLYGWADTDGDGASEILSSLP
ncbi:MAG: hypothetical protein AABO57_05650 [Acidobacteriota bacterium]